MAYGQKTGGRTKGTPNKDTAEKKERAERILQIIETEYFDQDIKKLTSAQRLDLYSSMLEYVLPKLSRQELKGGLNNKNILEIVRTTSQATLINTPSPSTNGHN